MKINSLRQSFGTAYVTMSKPNLANVISKNINAYNRSDFKKMYKESLKSAQDVINKVNAEMKDSNGKIKTVEDLTEKADFYVLAGGAGSRFKPLSTVVACLKNKKEQFNKISIPFELENGQHPLTMLDIPMSMGRFFADENGYRKIVADKSLGNFYDVIMNYAETGKEPKDVVVCCGDNVFDLKSEDMLEYIVKTINNPQKQLGVVGVARTPEEVANRFGLLDVGTKDKKTGLYSLKRFIEKPNLNVARNFTNYDGVCIANTGMFVIKKETMERLIEELSYNPNLIAKNEKEIYDFANATKWARKINGESAADVMLVKLWEDLGEPKAYHNWMLQLKRGHYLNNFTPKRSLAIYETTQDRVDENHIQFSVKPKGEKLVCGIRIIA